MFKNLFATLIFSFFVFTLLAFSTNAALYQSLGAGSRGQQVTELQQTLTNLKFYSGPITGYFGNLTRVAVIKFQRAYSISPAIGFVGPLTRTRLNQLAQENPTTQSITIPQPGSTPAPVISAQLKSKFFQGDPVAENTFKEGKTAVDIKDAGLGAGKVLNDSSFAWKFINGLRQVGYPYPGIPYELTPATPQSVRILNRFQKVNGLSLSDKISNRELIRLDKILSEREAEDAVLAQSFPLTKSILTYSGEASAEHFGALFTIAFGALPQNLVKWSATNFLDYIRTQGSGGDAYGIRTTQEGKICLPNMLSRFDEQCVFKGGSISLGGFKDDFSFIYNLLHEYAHYLDGGKFMYTTGEGTSRGIINTDGFTAISYDVSSFCPTTWRQYKLKSPDNIKNEFVTNYAVGYTSNVDPGCRSSIEDFAESFAMYVLQGNVFRKLTENKPVLATKYTWLRQNVFAGKEYSTGDVANIELVVRGLQQPYQFPIAGFTDYTLINPNFVWDYIIK